MWRIKIYINVSFCESADDSVDLITSTFSIKSQNNVGLLVFWCNPTRWLVRSSSHNKLLNRNSFCRSFR